MAKARKQVSVTLHVTVEVTDEASLFAAAGAATDRSLPDAFFRLYTTDAAAAVQLLSTPQHVVADIPGVSYRECRYEASEATPG